MQKVITITIIRGEDGQPFLAFIHQDGDLRRLDPADQEDAQLFENVVNSFKAR